VSLPLRAGEGALLRLRVDRRVRDMRVPTAETAPLSHTWRFAPDPGDVGLSRGWADPSLDDSAWAPQRDDIGVGWEAQGFPGYTGIGWYRQKLRLSGKLDKAHVYLRFTAVDEEAWVYINGALAFEHSCKSTGMWTGIIWNMPFDFDAAPWLKRGQENTIVVRVSNVSGRGGVYLPVYAVASDRELKPLEIAHIVEADARDGRP
jgi:beta-galactosidase/beta-glucuronidase